jgi:general secretion pathway protein C
LPAQWLSKSSDVSGRLTAAVEDAVRGLAQPARSRRLRQVLMALFALWGVLALSRLIWSLVPTPTATLPADVTIINPVTQPDAKPAASSVDIERMTGWHLFGEPGADVIPQIPVEEEIAAQRSARDGIEEGARETRLDLTLRGVVASTADGLGHAIIEYRKRQDVYAVEDKLPVPGQVTLAKVMPNQVVLDNGGTYELLTLFEETELEAQLPAQPPAAPRASVRGGGPAAVIDKREDSGATALAQQYRDQLYQDPQSLAQVVRVSAVREDGALLGYRIGPGEKREQFEALGFEPGDLVTSVNGIALNDPANTMRLYQTMRSASEAVFELTRKEQQLMVSVSLDGAGSGP